MTRVMSPESKESLRSTNARLCEMQTLVQTWRLDDDATYPEDPLVESSAEMVDEFLELIKEMQQVSEEGAPDNIADLMEDVVIPALAASVEKLAASMNELGGYIAERNRVVGAWNAYTMAHLDPIDNDLDRVQAWVLQNTLN